jgi:hypothetical protein
VLAKLGIGVCLNDVLDRIDGFAHHCSLARRARTGYLGSSGRVREIAGSVRPDRGSPTNLRPVGNPCWNAGGKWTRSGRTRSVSRRNRGTCLVVSAVGQSRSSVLQTCVRRNNSRNGFSTKA